MTATRIVHMGFEGTLTIASCTGFRNIRLSKSQSEIDITTNQDGGYKTYAKGMVDRTITADLDLSAENASAVVALADGRASTTVSVTLGGTTTTFTGLVFGGEVGGTMDDALFMPITIRPTRTAVTFNAQGTDPAAVATGGTGNIT